MGPAGFFLPAQGIELLLFRLNLVLLPYQTTGADQQYQTRHGDPPKQQKNDAPPDAPLDRSEKDAEKAVQNKNGAEKYPEKDMDNKRRRTLSTSPLFVLYTDGATVGSLNRTPRALSTMPEQSLHSPDTSFLGFDDGLQGREKLRADGIPQSVYRQPYGSLMVRDHLPDKIGVDIVAGAGIFHLGKHVVGNLTAVFFIQT